MSDLNANSRPDLRGQVAVVTGASRGIGRAVAEYLAASGARVAGCARDANELRNTCMETASAGLDILPIPADVTKGDEVEAAMSEAERQLGPVTLLVNNAGRGHCIGPIWETDADDWWADVEVNLRGTFLCSRAAMRRMAPRHQGRIINMSSAAGNMTLPMATSYACSKAAVQRLTDCLAEGGKAYGIFVFAISPGPTRTAMTRYVLESEAGKKWMPDFQRIPPEQWTDPEKIGKLIAVIASGKADALSGRFIHLRLDLSSLISRSDEIRKNDLYTLRLRE